jgi:hypothetical protein
LPVDLPVVRGGTHAARIALGPALQLGAAEGGIAACLDHAADHHRVRQQVTHLAVERLQAFAPEVLAAGGDSVVLHQVVVHVGLFGMAGVGDEMEVGVEQDARELGAGRPAAPVGVPIGGQAV